MTLTLYLPRDTAALALGAEAVALRIEQEASRRGIGLNLVRTGSRGMVWLEPLLEVSREGVRTGFGPLEEDDVGLLFENDFTDHPKALGAIGDIPFFARQTRLTFARCGVIDPLDLDAYRAHGGLSGLARAQAMTPMEIVEEIIQSGLRGRGGAGFPAGIKWRTTLETNAPSKVIVANADEGDSGTFADRMLMEGDPFALLEGMTIAGRAVGADRGFIYLRSEYTNANRILKDAINVFSDHVLTDIGFSIELRLGAGAYVCGEETALLNSLEGKRGTVRPKPPLPAIAGFLGRPTVVNNVLTLAAVPHILADGAPGYAAHGTVRSRGTVAVQIGGNVRYGGLFETGFGISLGELVTDIGGGTATGRPIKAVQLGGPLGAYFPPALFDTRLDYEECTAAGGLLGHAGIVVHDDSADMARLARFAMEFCAVESCGTCTPCRIGAVRGIETIDRMIAGDPQAAPLLADLCEVMREGSLCALGGFAPYPVESALKHFPADFNGHRTAAE
ncbi:formate dehydrogenase beta subunit [Rhodovulum bhavnagarense]|uniref:Formate dehydrogenase beta subunit n=1 Tax=Rhodovulum bhavnagarense TaxID=992286 RepID=A0A4R2RGA2_9RHOB|nr:formate dehydrogenase beta subunit [Rhodovulum bhavnagarense]TCP61963.1 formate dehydrogenase beta subunit [Rhodovulum bhavnagarense]